MIYSITSRGRSEAGYRVGLSSRRSRVQAPSLPLSPIRMDGRFFTGSSAGGSALGSGLRGRGFKSRLPDILPKPEDKMYRFCRYLRSKAGNNPAVIIGIYTITLTLKF